MNALLIMEIQQIFFLPRAAFLVLLEIRNIEHLKLEEIENTFLYLATFILFICCCFLKLFVSFSLGFIKPEGSCTLYETMTNTR